MESKHIANFKILYNNEKTGWNTYIRFVYRGKFGYGDINGDNIADDKGEMVNGFLMVNAALAKSITNHFQLQAGVENIFNYTNAQRVPNIPGRLFFVNINYSFGKTFQKNKTK